MPLFNIKWSVTDIVNGPGKHDRVVDGQRTEVARGQVQKEASSEASIRDELTSRLKEVFPEKDLGPTYNIDRVYNIDIQEVHSAVTV